MLRRLSQILFLVPIVVALLCLTGEAEGACSACNPKNQASCINETSYYACINGVESRDTVFSCPENYVCSDSQLLCIQRGNGPISCSGEEVGCNTCALSSVFACISRKQYAQCGKDGKVTRNIGTCPPGTVCNTKGGEICVSDCNKPQCDREQPIF